MRDNLIVLQEFGTAVAKAMQHIPPPYENEICAVMIVVGQFPDPPLGANINYNKETKLWEMEVEVQISQPIGEIPMT